MKRFRLLAFFLSIALFSISCDTSDPKLAYPADSSEQLLYDFFNDVRLQVAVLEPGRKQLEGWMPITKEYLESSRMQKMYQVAGMYFEANKDRTRGGSLAKRFFDNGCQIHIMIYPVEEQSKFTESIGVDGTYGGEMGKYYVVYQIYTAQPERREFEADVKAIIEDVIAKYETKMKG